MSPASYQTAPPRDVFLWRAGNGTRTRDPNLGKVVLYQLSYSRNDEGRESSRVPALAQPLRAHPATRSCLGVEARGIEPLTS